MQKKSQINLSKLPILPGNGRMLQSARATLQRLAGSITDEQARFELTSIDFILSELQLREQTAFFTGYYFKSVELARQGLAQLSNHKLSTGAASIGDEIAALPTNIGPDERFESISSKINAAMQCLHDLVLAFSTTKSDAGADAAAGFVQRAVAHEDALHQHRMKSPYAAPPAIRPAGIMDLTSGQLEAYLQQKFPDMSGLRVKSLKRLVGGYQKTTILFETEDASGVSKSLVLRAERSGERFQDFDLGLIVAEYEMLAFAYQAGLPVAEPLWLESDATRLGERFLVSSKMPGVNLGTAVAAAVMSETVARAFIHTMAKIHRVPVDSAMRKLPIGHWAEYPTMHDNTRAYIDFIYNQNWAHGAPSPVLARLHSWLLANVPEEDGVLCLVHCDFGPHNILVHEDKISAVLDWESARIGDPAEEISWFLRSLNGRISVAQALDWYEAETGQRISEFRLRYFDVVTCLKTMMAMFLAPAMFEHTETAGVEWCNFPLRWVTYATSSVETIIAAAEKAKS